MSMYKNVESEAVDKDENDVDSDYETPPAVNAEETTEKEQEPPVESNEAPTSEPGENHVDESAHEVETQKVPSHDEDDYEKFTSPPVKPSGTATTVSSGASWSKAAELRAFDRRNWLLHAHFTREEFDVCKALITEILKDSQDSCEFALYIRALIQRQEGEIEESLETLHKCVLLNSQSVEYVKQIGRSLLLLGKHRQAIDVLQQALRMASGDWEPHYWMAVCYRYLGDLSSAQACCVAALEQEKHERALQLLAEIADQSAVAVECLKKCIDICPDNADAQCALGLLYIDTQSYQQAFEALGRALAVDQQHTGAILAAGSMMQKYGDFDVAITKYRLAATIIPDSAQLWNNIGMCFYGKRKFVASVSCLKRAAYLAQLDYRIQYNLALAHLALGQSASAMHFISSAINLQPNSAALFSLLGVILYKLEDVNNAVKAHQRAMTLDENDPVVALNYACFECKRGNMKVAAELMETYSQRVAVSSYSVDKEALELAEKLRERISGPPPDPKPSVQSSTGGEEFVASAPPATATTALESQADSASQNVRFGSAQSSNGQWHGDEHTGTRSNINVLKHDTESLITMHSKYSMPDDL